MSQTLKMHIFPIRFYSKNEVLNNSVDLSCAESDKSGSASDDEDLLCAFYQLPDIDLNQNDEEKFFTLMRWNDLVKVFPIVTLLRWNDHIEMFQSINHYTFEMNRRSSHSKCVKECVLFLLSFMINWLKWFFPFIMISIMVNRFFSIALSVKSLNLNLLPYQDWLFQKNVKKTKLINWKICSSFSCFIAAITAIF